jgi:hypothetical protein
VGNRISTENILAAATQEQLAPATTLSPEQGPPETFASRPSDVITFEQVGLLLTRFSQIVVQEIPERYCTNILKRADKLSRSFGVELKREAMDDWP